MQFDVGRVQGSDEFGETFALIGDDHFGQQRLLDLRLAGRLIDCDIQFQCFCVYIVANVAFVMKQNGVTTAMRVDANVDLFAGYVRNERFDDELLQFTGGTINLNLFVESFANPLLTLSNILIFSDQAELASLFDQLVWFGD